MTGPPGGGDRLALRARGFLSDTITAALVAADGALDWFCPAGFDRPASLFRLLDPAGGAVRIAPVGAGGAGRQSYDAGTNLLRTVLTGADGEIEILDVMPWEPGQTPAGRVVRIVTARRGPVTVDVDVVPGARWSAPRRVLPFSGGLAFDGMVVRTPTPVEGRRARVVLATGEQVVVTVDPHGDRDHPVLSPPRALDLAARTATAWRSHGAPLSYTGPYRDAVERSLLVLKGLTVRGEGAVVAAPTTSLPLRAGGERNLDLRYAWTRHAASAARVLRACGLDGEAHGVAGWLARVVRAGIPPAAVLRTDGSPLPTEETTLPLAGWERSQPVREGNRAGELLDLGVLAHVFGVLGSHDLGSDHPLMAAWGDLAAATDWLADHWSDPDAGLWQLRSGTRQLVGSKLDAWWALDHLGRLGQRRNPLDLAPVAWRMAAREALDWLDDHAIAADGHLLHAAGRSTGPDASLLRVAWLGPWPPDHPRVTATVDHVLGRLSDGPHVYRYREDVDDGFPSGEGAWVTASFWAVRALARLERWDDAHERMERLVELARPLGLLPEAIDPLTGAFLGNLPHTPSHLALIDAALALDAGPR